MIKIFLADITISSLESNQAQSDDRYTSSSFNRYYKSSANAFDEKHFDFENGDNDEVVKNPLDRGPYFDITASKNVTALVGNTVYLNCRVKNLGNRTVIFQNLIYELFLTHHF
jgi:hypothetical protein